MDSTQLKELQAPLKAAYSATPEQAVAELHATGHIDFAALTCRVDSPQAQQGTIASGLHPKAGGDGTAACSGDMLLQSLVACSGVTFAAVATAMDLQIDTASVHARGVMDFRGTLGVDRSVPIGLTSIELQFSVTSNESDEKIEKLIQLTERYCVVLKTLSDGVAVSSRRTV